MSPLILDCTIRDGGYVNNWNFTYEQVRECYKSCALSNIEYIELGFRNRKTVENVKKYGATFFCDENFINEITAGIDGPTVAVMVTINEFNIEDFVDSKDSKIKLVRVLMAYHGGKNGDDSILDIKQLNDGVVQIKQLISKGYNVSFNLGRVDKISNEQLFEICNKISDTGIEYFTLADTYGSIDLTTIESLIPYVKKTLSKMNTNIKIGFHAHDNCANGTSKALYSLKFGVDCIDGCIMGYGRGSGNAKTELLCMDLVKNHNKKYNFIHLFNYADKYISNYKECKHNQSYNIIYALTAYLGCHVSYAINIIEDCPKMSIYDIYNTLLALKNNNKHIFYDDKVFAEDIHKFSVDSTIFKYTDSDIDNFKIKSYNKTYEISYVNDSINDIISSVYSPGDFIIVDKNVSNTYPINDRYLSNHYIIDAVESNKNIETVLNVIDILYNLKFNKKYKIIVIGGGIVQDIGGTVASLYKRGVDWIFVPTTLLSMTDSAIGGKLGINRHSKNIIGIFNSPVQVIISNNFLATLKHCDIISGLGESLKLCLIGGEKSYKLFYDNYKQSNLMEIIKISNNIKRIIIEEDELEINIRKCLNYGHTFGHAIESATNYKIPHGISVLYGMYIIHKLFKSDKFQDVNNLILNMIPEEFKNVSLSFDKFYFHIQNDKKNSGDNILFIILNSVGNTIFECSKLEDIKEKLELILHSLFINQL